MHVDRSPFKDRFAVTPDYPQIGGFEVGTITVGKKTYDYDILVRVNGKVKRRKKKSAKATQDDAHVVGAKELERVCKGGPEIVFVGTGASGETTLSDEAKRFLSQRSIALEARPTPEVIDAYNESTLRKAALLRINS
jgi:hypothetical protein